MVISVVQVCQGRSIRDPPQHIVAKVGETVTFTCEIDAEDPTMSWSRDIHAKNGEEQIAFYFKGVSICISTIYTL